MQLDGRHRGGSAAHSSRMHGTTQSLTSARTLLPQVLLDHVQAQQQEAASAVSLTLHSGAIAQLQQQVAQLVAQLAQRGQAVKGAQQLARLGSGSRTGDLVKRTEYSLPKSGSEPPAHHLLPTFLQSCRRSWKSSRRDSSRR